MKPEGGHAATLTKIVPCEATNGTAQIALCFELDQDKYGAIIYLFVTPNALQNTKDKLARMGWNGSLRDPKVTRTKGVIYCRHEVFDGETREKWDLARPLPKAVSDDKLAAMERMLGAAAPSPSRGEGGFDDPDSPPPSRPGQPRPALSYNPQRDAKDSMREEDIPF